jgi:hypothetical protein
VNFWLECGKIENGVKDVAIAVLRRWSLVDMNVFDGVDMW